MLADQAQVDAVVPTSKLEQWPLILHHAWQISQRLPEPIRVLDVGPGHGKGGVLVKEYVDAAAVIDAIELEPRYHTRQLEGIYRRVIIGDACGLTPDDLIMYDLVLMIDVVEHMPKQAAVQLLGRIPGSVIVCTPVEFFQNPEADLGWETERHVSHWRADEFRALGFGAEVHLGGIVAWRSGPYF